MKTARTGLALEKELYLLAQKVAAERGSSFADYVTTLITHDLIDHPEGERSARIRALREDRVRLNNPMKVWSEIEKADTREERSNLRGLAMRAGGKPAPKPRKPKAA